MSQIYAKKLPFMSFTLPFLNVRLLCLMNFFAFHTSWIFVHCERRITKNFDDDWIKFMTDHQERDLIMRKFCYKTSYLFEF